MGWPKMLVGCLPPVNWAIGIKGGRRQMRLRE